MSRNIRPVTCTWCGERCARVADSTTNPTLVQQQNVQLQQRSAQGEVAAYINEAKRKAKIVKNLAVFE